MFRIACLRIVFVSFFAVSASANSGLISGENLTLNGIAEVANSGLLTLTNSTPNSIGRAFYKTPFKFKNTSNSNSNSNSNANASSFSSVFVFALVPVPGSLFTSDGMAFIISPFNDIPGAASGKYLGLFNRNSNGNSSNHIIAVELDIIQNEELGDINGNHVGIDINRIESVASTPAGYFVNGEFKNLTLASGNPIIAWVDYDGGEKLLNVTLAPLHHGEKPSRPVLSAKIDISPYILNDMYVGFSSATGALVQASYVLAWNFAMNVRAQELDLSALPSIPGRKGSKKREKLFTILLPVIGSVLILTAIFLIYYQLNRKSKYAEVLEDWEIEYGPHRFSYKELYKATKGFSEKELLGRGGFGQVYHGVLRSSRDQIAVKRISHGSANGMKGFVAEIATIGRIRHPNLVRLLGYCRREGELFLVYDYMPNRSLDKFIFDDSESILNWNQRFNVIKGVASALTYLHEEWVEVIIHRDIKASNVLLDGEFNGKLGDFGLARLSYPGKDPQTTQLAGTLGYIAPELAVNGKSNTRTDVFSFGAFCLEVACGRRPLEQNAPPGEVNLVDWVAECWKKGQILKTADPKLGNEFKVEEMGMVLKLGLLSTQFEPEVRPSMSQIRSYLNGDFSDLENPDDILMKVQNWKDLKHLYATHTSPLETKDYSNASVTISEMFTSVGR